MKNIVIIGGSSGIGQACVEQMANNAKIVATYNATEPATHKEIYHHLDVANPDYSFLPEVIDGLVYCPGKIKLTPFAKIKKETFIADYEVQVLGAIQAIQACLPAMKKSQSASIVLFSTVAVQSGFNYHSVVSSSKGAIEGLTRALSAELAPKIRVNAIAPSIVNTPLAGSLLNSDAKLEANNNRHPLKRVGQAEDIANAVEYLISDKSSWTTGQILKVDGGISDIKL